MVQEVLDRISVSNDISVLIPIEYTMHVGKVDETLFGSQEIFDSPQTHLPPFPTFPTRSTSGQLRVGMK
jgi:hypothetical protein